MEKASGLTSVYVSSVFLVRIAEELLPPLLEDERAHFPQSFLVGHAEEDLLDVHSLKDARSDNGDVDEILFPHNPSPNQFS